MNAVSLLSGFTSDVCLSCHSSMPLIRRQDAVREGWATLMGRVHWDWFVTLTNRDGVSNHVLEKAFGVFIQRLGRQVAGRRWYNRDPTPFLWARAFEHGSGSGAHVHCLIASNVKPNARHELIAATKHWRYRVGHVDVERVHDNAGVIAYLTKGIGRGADLYVSPGLPKR